MERIYLSNTPIEEGRCAMNRTIHLTVRQVYQQYCLPRVVSQHTLHLADCEKPIRGIKIVPNGGATILYYRILFNDDSEKIVDREHPCLIEIQSGVLHNY